MINEIMEHFQKIIDLGKDKCCVCHHDLGDHIDEGNIWRCHSLGADGYQCECALRKDRTEKNISFYDLARRAKEQVDEVKLIEKGINN
jgi:hypothetical protein